MHSPDPINPRRVVPPISSPDQNASIKAEQNSNPEQPTDIYDKMQAMLRDPDPPARSGAGVGIDLLKYLPRTDNLPQRPIDLGKEEELELRHRIKHDLANFETRKLKDVYLELTGFDRDLTGYVGYSDLGYALLRKQV